MAGKQNPPPTGFPNAQPNAVRNQFSGGQLVSGLRSPQQGMSSQQLGGGVGAGVGQNPNALGMLNPQQVMAQQQLMQQQMQRRQQMLLQQQQQQAALAQQNNQVFVAPAAPPMPAPRSQPPAPRPPNSRDWNTAALCKSGQEHVQEIVSRVQEVFQTLKVIQPPNGVPQGLHLANERKKRLQEHTAITTELFKRLRLIYDKCNENCQLQGMEYTHIESLIPIKEERDMTNSDEKKASETYKLACEEHKELKEQLVLRNQQLKEIIDHVRRIVSEVNTMMAMRRS